LNLNITKYLILNVKNVLFLAFNIIKLW